MSRNNLAPMRVYAHMADIGFTNFIDMFTYKLLDNYNKFNENLEIDVIQFQKRINKLCKVYRVTEITAKRAFKRLAKLGLVEIVYTLGFGKYVVKVKSFADILGHDDASKTDVIEEKSPEERNSEQTQKTRVKQQQLILTKQICQAEGLNYRLEKDWWEIASHGIEKIKATIKKMYERFNPRNPIYNPCGWFRTALRDNYYLDESDTISELSMLERVNKHVRNRFIELVGCVPT
ncbi:MAG: hypothetical protein QNJ53_24445 [Pleurocapsa sp. MO_192.B19]|nr:hypothetical protein [Pleurocapsa sp. MO_192.B19]